MKVTVTMKDPDVLRDAIEDAVRETLNGIADKDEQAAILEVRCDKVAEIAAKWFMYGEYLSVEIDTDKETITVLDAE